MGRLAFHVNALTPTAKSSLVASPTAWLKLLNTALDVRFLDDEYLPRRPDARIIYREVFEDGCPQGDVTGRVDRLCRNAQPLLKYGRHVVYETPWNEQMQDDTLLAMYSDRTCQAVDMMQARGFEAVAVGHFSVQWPRPSGRHLFLPAIRKGDYFSLHTYSAPTIWDGYGHNVGHGLDLARWVSDQTGKQTLITEFGVDFGVLGERLSGWRTRGLLPSVYAAHLRQFAQQLPSHVAAVCIFCCGQFGDWASFDVAGVGEIEHVMREEYPVYQFVLGFAELAGLMRQRGLDPGEPTENENPRVFEDGWQVTRQRTTTGVMLWIRDLNCPAFAGADRRLVSWDGNVIRVA